jgi:hypothetical protein
MHVTQPSTGSHFLFAEQAFVLFMPHTESSVFGDALSFPSAPSDASPSVGPSIGASRGVTGPLASAAPP